MKDIKRVSVLSCSKNLVPKATFHSLALCAAAKTLPEETCARRGAEVAEIK
jgi:hypothetical protein